MCSQSDSDRSQIIERATILIVGATSCVRSPGERKVQSLERELRDVQIHQAPEAGG